MSKAMTAATKEQLIELMQYLSQNISVPTIGIGGGFAPIGTIISYMGTTAPQDYLICDGTTYNIADYKQLSDFFAAQFGSANFFGGDGVTTFKVPDLRGEFLRGTGINRHSGQGGGDYVGVHQDATFIPIIGGNQNQSKILVRSTTGTKDWTSSYNHDATKQSDTSGCHYDANISGNFVTDFDYPTEYSTRPTNTSVLYCIKAVAAGDVYSTTERVVGTWIDGKKVYEKTIVDTLPIATEGTNTDKYIQLNESIDNGFVYNSFIVDTNKSIPLLFMQNDTGKTRVAAKLFLNNAASNANTLQLTNNREYLNEVPVYAILRYTKTTD